jgi:membrane-associated phospholipid phosphatase
MDIYLIRDYIGVYAPIILFIFSIVSLRNKITYLNYFIFGFLFNNLINIILKLLIKEPRPSDDQKIIEIAVFNNARVSFDKFGMPSGHAQNCGFIFAFITLTLTNYYISSIVLFISVISMIQRYLYKNHTLIQIFIGFIVGLFMGYLFYKISSKKITGNIKHKRDDYGPT